MFSQIRAQKGHFAHHSMGFVWNLEIPRQAASIELACPDQPRIQPRTFNDGITGGCWS